MKSQGEEWGMCVKWRALEGDWWARDGWSVIRPSRQTAILVGLEYFLVRKHALKLPTHEFPVKIQAALRFPKKLPSLYPGPRGFLAVGGAEGANERWGEDLLDQGTFTEA